MLSPTMKKGGLDAVMIEYVENPRRYLGYRAVVKGRVNGAFVLVHPPQRVGIQPAQEPGGLFDYHGNGVVVKSQKSVPMHYGLHTLQPSEGGALQAVRHRHYCLSLHLLLVNVETEGKGIGL